MPSVRNCYPATSSSAYSAVIDIPPTIVAGSAAPTHGFATADTLAKHEDILRTIASYFEGDRPSLTHLGSVNKACRRAVTTMLLEAEAREQSGMGPHPQPRSHVFRSTWLPGPDRPSFATAHRDAPWYCRYLRNLLTVNAGGTVFLAALGSGIAAAFGEGEAAVGIATGLGGPAGAQALTALAMHYGPGLLAAAMTNTRRRSAQRALLAAMHTRQVHDRPLTADEAGAVLVALKQAEAAAE